MCMKTSLEPQTLVLSTSASHWQSPMTAQRRDMFSPGPSLSLYLNDALLAGNTHQYMLVNMAHAETKRSLI